MTDGLTKLPSASGFAETCERLEKVIESRGATIVARVDHAAAAAKVGLTLRPTTVFIFGNPKAGTPLMQAVQTIGIDLPLKALVYEDDNGKTWVAYNDPKWLATRHGAAGVDAVLNAMSEGLAAIAKSATG
jgi:uncharacterized protein (DUF302 family)